MSERDIHELKEWISEKIEGVTSSGKSNGEILLRLEKTMSDLASESKDNTGKIIRLEEKAGKCISDIQHNFDQHEKFYNRIGKLEKVNEKEAGQKSVVRYLAGGGSITGLAALIWKTIEWLNKA